MILSDICNGLKINVVSDNKMMTGTEQRKILNYKLKSSTEIITSTVKKFDQLLNELDCCSSREKNEIATALSEALANAIIHGNQADSRKMVDLTIKIDQDNIQFSIQDEGLGFNPGRIKNPTDPANILKKNGRGIYLMSIFMDEVKYSRQKKGMKVTLTKYLRNKK